MHIASVWTLYTSYGSHCLILMSHTI